MTITVASELRQACETLARSAGALVRARFGLPGVVHAKDADSRATGRVHDVVTEVDHLSEAHIASGIGAIDPGAVLLAEEGGLMDVAGSRLVADPTQVEQLWIIDPLDGTMNFAHGIPHFGISIAVWRAGAPYAGAIVDPMVGECFSFERPASGPQRAFVNGRPAERVNAPAAAESIIYVGGGGPHLPPLLREFQAWRRLGAASLALAWTGAGRCAAYVQGGRLRPWDWAVGVPFIEAAGGVVTDYTCDGWPAPLDGPTGIVAASSAQLHELVAGHVRAPRSEG